jgi:hypothetical protein
MTTETERIHWKKVFNSDYLGSCDLEDGKDLKAIIKSVNVANVKGLDGKSQERNVAQFTDPAIKPMILNATNCKIVKEFAKSSFINDWNNVPVLIYTKGDIKVFGEITEGLRIREIQPEIGKKQLTPTSKAWSNAVEFLKKDGNTIAMIEAKYDISVQDRETLISAAL